MMMETLMCRKYGFTTTRRILILVLSLLVFHGGAFVDGAVEVGKEKGTPSLTPAPDAVEATSTLKNHTKRYPLISFNFEHVELPYVICLWILLASIAKIGFHLYDKLPRIFPESCLLITLGTLVGVTLYYTGTANSAQYSLDATTFFLFLLPPIIYDAGYHMPNRAFFNNMGTILLLAVVNTMWNTIGIGVGLWGMSYLGWIHKPISILHCLVFSALISAVDPVAVLAIFEEIQINEILYIIVFGESLLNDGVTVVIYHMMEGFTEIGENNLQVIDFVTGFAQFFIVVLGGTLIGVVYGLVGAFITKYTDHVRTIEPLFIFLLGYLAYLTAESMELSGILALTFGGIIMRHYTEANMTKKSTTAVKYFMKMFANVSETIIFMFLGLSTVIDSHDWQLDFILFTILFCLIFRVTGVIFLSFLVNRRRVIRLSAIDQFIMSYGGLRGGIAFCLALSLDKHHIPEKAMFVTTTTVIVFFTVFAQGITIKPVVNALKVERTEEKDPSMNEMIHKRFIDHLMAGVEDIVGKSGHNSIQHKFEYYNTKYLKPWLLKEKPKSRDHSIVRTFTKLNMQEAKAAVKEFSSGISRDPSILHMRRSSTTASLFSQHTGYGAPMDRGPDTVLNLYGLDPNFKRSVDDSAMQQVLEHSMYPPGNPLLRERRHTLAEIHNHSGLQHPDREKMQQHLLTDFHSNHWADDTHSGLYVNGNATPSPSGARSRRIRKNVSFSSVHSRLGKKLSDVVESSPSAQESANVPQEYTPSREVTFTLGMPAPHQTAAEPDSITEEEMSAPAVTPSDPEMDDHDPNPSTTNPAETPTSTPATAATEPAVYYALVTNDTPFSRPPDIAYTHTKVSPTIPIPITDKASAISWDSGQGSGSPAADDTDPKLHALYEHEFSKDETVAESTLPWRRQSSLPPVPSSVSLSLPDDENPLMSEAPSWADNLAYNNLTETGSPCHSPQTTIVKSPPPSQPRPVFDIFPPSSPSHEDDHMSPIPPPWSVTGEDSDQSKDPLPSQAQAVNETGDKASCLLMSSHDLVPPAYHSCLEVGAHSVEGGDARRAATASSPIHFQVMEKPDLATADSIESKLIGIEADYQLGMADRVSRWLANTSSPRPEGEELPGQGADGDDSKFILDSLREKQDKWTFRDTDDGTDADVESDCDMEDTRL